MTGFELLVSEATALPTVPQPEPNRKYVPYKFLHRLDSNHRSFTTKATGLPTELHPLSTKFCFRFVLITYLIKCQSALHGGKVDAPQNSSNSSSNLVVFT